MLAQTCIRGEKRLDRARSLLFEATDFVAQSGRFFVDFLGDSLAQASFELPRKRRGTAKRHCTAFPSLSTWP